MMDSSEIERGCVLPVLQSLITGIFVGLIVAGLALWAKVSEAWWLALVAGSGAAFLWWAGSIRLWRLAVYGTVEPEAAEPMKKVEELEMIRIPVAQENQIVFAELPITESQMRDLATGLLAGMSFSEGGWSGEGGIFSRSQFRQVRNVFIQKGWASWANPKSKNQGVELTHAGRSVCKWFAKG